MRERLARWLDLRPQEVRLVGLSFAGAFLSISFLVLGRSLREAIYLTSFPVETLPYITAAVAISSVPTVALFARLLAGGRPKRVLVATVVVVGLGLVVLGPLVDRSDLAVIAFYLWTALGTLLLTSGFWLITAELFPVRGAKRVFGLIGAGGTAGAMAAGNALAVASRSLATTSLIPGLVLLLALFLAVQLALPSVDTGGPVAGNKTGMREAFELAWRTPHLRTIALLVAAATVASTLVDYQFKELARASLDTGERLAGFFGAFYGWTGAASLALQVLVTGRLLGRAGIAVTLGVLPVILLFGSAGLLVVPGIVVATLVRGADNALRKSLHRSALEVLYVPVPAGLRRRTKTFIDSVADSAAEGIGAALVFLVVTFGGLPSRLLSVLVAALAVGLLWLARRARRTYVATVTAQLRRGAREAVDLAGAPGGADAGRERPTDFDVRSAMEEVTSSIATAELTGDASLAQALLEDLRGPERTGRAPALPQAGLTDPGVGSRPHSGGGPRPDVGVGPQPGADTFMRTGEGPTVLAMLGEDESWDPDDIPLLTRLLARDSLYHGVADALARHERQALEHLAGVLRDASADFAIRRRIPAVLARYGDVAADEALLEGVVAPRFEVRYRCAIALAQRRRDDLPTSPSVVERTWEAIRGEVSRERPVWELQRLLDDDDPGDALVADRVEVRGHLSLEHTFRLLSLVLDADAVSSAYHGLLRGDEHLRSLALEYLDHVLPEDVRDRLWPFIGDLSEYQRRRRSRPLGDVVSDLVTTSATLFVSDRERGALRRLLEEGNGE